MSLLLSGSMGCRGPAPVEAAAPEPVAVPSGAAESDEPPEPAGSNSSSGGPAARPEPPPLQSLQALDVPFASDAVVVGPVSDELPVVLFADERAALRRRVAQQLAVLGYAVVPMERLEAVESAAAEGRLLLEGDRQCRAPLSPSDVVARYFGTHPRASTWALTITNAGHVQVDVDRRDGSEAAIFHSGGVSRPHEPRGWARITLEPSEIGYGFRGSGFGSSRPPPIMFGTPESIGPWATPPSQSDIREAESAVAGCAHPDPRVGIEYVVRAMIGKGGEIERCSSTSHHSLARAEDGACLCRGLQGLHFGRGRRGRRLRFTARDDGRFSLADLRALQPGTEAWVHRLRESPVVSRCVDGVPELSSLSATVVLTLAEDGEVRDAQVFGDITTPTAIDLARCLVAGLPDVALPCRPPGIEVLQAQLELGPP